MSNDDRHQRWVKSDLLMPFRLVISTWKNAGGNEPIGFGKLGVIIL